MSLELAERAVRAADLDTALELLQQHVRRQPLESAPRVFLFQLLAVLGQWDRAAAQLAAAADLDAGALALAQVYGPAIACEQVRIDVFAGVRAPLVMAPRAEWLDLLFESLAAGRQPGAAAAAKARALRDAAFEAAPPTEGTLDGASFGWIADADMRCGPVCEVIVNGGYHWVPFERLTRLEIEAPADLRDLVWTPARLQFVDGSDAAVLIPTRYPGSETSADARVRLARQTEWREVGADEFHGLGQRVWTTDTGEYGVMDVRSVRLGDAATTAAIEAQHA
jgi:type VI secretion system protein ImpE